MAKEKKPVHKVDFRLLLPLTTSPSPVMILRAAFSEMTVPRG